MHKKGQASYDFVVVWMEGRSEGDLSLAWSFFERNATFLLRWVLIDYILGGGRDGCCLEYG